MNLVQIVSWATIGAIFLIVNVAGASDALESNNNKVLEADDAGLHNGFIDEPRHLRNTRMLIDAKIVGGSPAKLSEFPYFAQWWGNPVGSSTLIIVCGATLIHVDMLLTSAQCTSSIVNNVTAVVGAYYFLSSTVGTPRKVVARSVHPNFDNKTFFNDFAVLKLDSPVPQVTPVALNSKSTSPAGSEQVTIIGLGSKKEDGKLSNILMKVNVRYVNPSTCAAAYELATPPFPIDGAIEMCTGVPGGGKGQCSGDAGGPVINSKGVQVGIVSASAGCARANYPGIQARVSSGLAWIRQQVCTLSAYPPTYCFSTFTSSTKLRFDLFYDQSSSQTSFKVFDGSQVVFKGGPSSSSANQLVTWTTTLPPGYYYAQLYDKIGDGFCCGSGYGFFMVHVITDGVYNQVIPPTYGSFLGKTSPNIPLNIPVSNPGITNTQNLRIEIYFDNEPTETSFVLYDSGNNAIASSGLGLPSYANKGYFWHYTVSPGYYTVQFLDSYGDGLCCGNGIGYYAVYTRTSRNTPPYYQAAIPPTYGTFSNSVNVVIFVPATNSRISDSKSADPLPPPPPIAIFASVCQDSPSTFSFSETIDGVVSEGTQTCQWLASNSAWKEILCQPDHPAYKTCPKTCEKCINPCEGQDNVTATFLIGTTTRDCDWLSTQSSLWPSECAPGKPAYTFCKDVCQSCAV